LDEAAHAALVEAGVHAWSSIDRVEKSSLEAMLAQARARCRREAALRLELVQMRTQMDDRKWVEKAKGLLMLARGMGEGEAFAMLRQTSMHANLRLGEVARSVVDAAQWAEAINRAGQLRMLSQRLARLAAQALTGVDVTRSRLLRRQTSDRVEENLAYLGALELPAAACVDFEHTKSAWRRLSAAWSARITREAMTAINAEAEALLASAEVLAASLEIASNRRALRVINLCGRQRMLTERIAKVTLLGEADSPGLVPLAEQFEQALQDLERAPLTSAEIRDLLVKAREEWLRLARGVQQMSRPQAGISLVRSAEALVTTFDQLAGEYEHSLQVILS
jgi:nitrate/nitrite-specific signal transduction histidine kinase